MTRTRVFLAAVLIAACRTSQATTVSGDNPSPRRFEELFPTASSVPLVGSTDSTSVYAALVNSRRMILLDEPLAEVRAYDRRSGKMTALVGGPGDGPEDFRLPTDISMLDSGRFAIYDSRRGRMSIRDSVGGLLGNVKLPRGYYGGFEVLPDHRHVVLTGDVIYATGEAKGTAIHEFDLAGNPVKSYAERKKPESEWAARFGAELVRADGGLLVTGTMSSSRLRLYDPATSRERWITLAPGWQHIDWPSDRTLGRANRQVASKRLRDFAARERMMNGVFALSHGRLLARFRGFRSDGKELYYYVLADTTGRTLGISLATRAAVVASEGDTLFWVKTGRPATFGASTIR